MQAQKCARGKYRLKETEDAPEGANEGFTRKEGLRGLKGWRKLLV